MSLYIFAAVLFAATSAHCTWMVCNSDETARAPSEAFGSTEEVGFALVNSWVVVTWLLLCLTLAVWYAAGLKNQVKHMQGLVKDARKVQEGGKGEKKAE